MDFFLDPTSLTDEDIQNSYYPGLESEADGIDLRIEMNRILYGSILKCISVSLIDIISVTLYAGIFNNLLITCTRIDYLPDYLVLSPKIYQVFNGNRCFFISYYFLTIYKNHCNLFTKEPKF